MSYPNRRLQRFHGARVGERAQAVYVCDRCGAWQTDIRTGLPLIKAQLDYFCIKPGCNSTTFTYFASKTEAKAYASLLLRVAAGEIADLELQPRYPLHAPDERRTLVWTYVGDFRYRDVKTGRLVVIDAKGDADTHISAAKRKHAAAEYGIEIRTMQP